MFFTLWEEEGRQPEAPGLNHGKLILARHGRAGGHSTIWSLSVFTYSDDK